MEATYCVPSGIVACVVVVAAAGFPDVAVPVPMRHVALMAMQVLPHGLPFTHFFCASATAGMAGRTVPGEVGAFQLSVERVTSNSIPNGGATACVCMCM
jgi:hypothetical protein